MTNPLVNAPKLFLLTFFLSVSTFAQNVSLSQVSDGVMVNTAHDFVHIAVCGPSMLHITAGPEKAMPSSPNQPWIVQQCTGDKFTLEHAEKAATLKTANLQLKIGLENGGLTFADSTGKALLTEGIWAPFSTRHYHDKGNGQFSLTDQFQMPEDEAIYGLGQHQSGVMNYRGTAVSLGQDNTDVAVPLLISTRGYGLLWNTAAQSTMNNQFPRSVIFTAETAEGLDYYFMYGPSADGVIHQYRELTGHAPLFAQWAYGFFQSKDRYKTQDELLGIVEQYRSRHIPLDTVVQDWQWWTKWGSSDFNSSYPDFTGAVKKIHDQHARVMISIWPNFDPSTPVYQQMKTQGFLIDEKGDYDVTNPAARELYWKLLPSTLIAKGVDAFWLDASEPEAGELGIPPGHKLNFGDGSLYTNIFPLLHTYGVYENWRKTSDQKRVFMLTRSAFLGQQRNSAATWSGDVYSNFWALKKQIPAGLNFSISGIPYWTTDIGGYGYPNGNTSDPAYQEVYTRWFEYGTFCPIFRTHGHRDNDTNELWSYGAAAPTLIRFDKLRYRLLPYIYSLAWQVTKNDYTIMRPLAMDWRDDRKVWDITDEFMFGPALLVAPVTEAGTTGRSVYLPAANGWYDFWTGEPAKADQAITAAAPIDRIPLYIRAGSIVPLGPEVEYAGSGQESPIELRVYTGANGQFTLYEDQGDGYGYEHGAYSTIPISCDAQGNVMIGARSGSYPGMPSQKAFRVVWVKANHGIGPEVTAQADREVTYTGQEITVKAAQ